MRVRCFGKGTRDETCPFFFSPPFVLNLLICYSIDTREKSLLVDEGISTSTATELRLNTLRAATTYHKYTRKNDIAVKELNYSQELVNLIKDVLSEDKLRFCFDEERGVFEFTVGLNRTLKNICYLIRIREDAYTVYAVSPIGVNEDDRTMMETMAEFICRMNFGLRNGSFDLDVRDGEIRYKSYVDSDKTVPSRAIIRNSIGIPLLMYERYSEGIVGIVFGGMSAEEAIDRCENRSKDHVREIVSSIVEQKDSSPSALPTGSAEDTGTGDTEPMQACTDEVSDLLTHIKTELFTDDGGATQ